MTYPLQVNELGKAFQLYDKPYDNLKEIFSKRVFHKKFWALQDVSFNLQAGKCLGVIGENGAGKTTLLQLLAGTIKPTCGQIHQKGRVSSILELGSGFHPNLSGLENIRLVCAMRGLSPLETEAVLPEILEFSELEESIERSVRTYSTGMYARLAFSVATAIEPDILIIDETLSVGDQHFQKKSMDRMVAFITGGKTIVFCSHTLYYIEQLCDECLWLLNGRTEMQGPTLSVTERYLEYVRACEDGGGPTTATSGDSPTLKKDKCTSEENYLMSVRLSGDCKNSQVRTGDTLRIEVEANLSRVASKSKAYIGIAITRSSDNVDCYGISSQWEDIPLLPLSKNRYGLAFVIDNLPLLSGEYKLRVLLFDENGMHDYDHWENVAPFVVSHRSKEIGIMRLPCRWEAPLEIL